jgi:hypothetical protein
VSDLDTNPDPAVSSVSDGTAAVRSSLDRLARSGERHLRKCRVAAVERTRSAALALYDRQLGLHDRLLTADEFLQSASGGGFEAAAMEDAARFLGQAESASLLRIERPEARSRFGSPWIYAGAGIALIALLVGLWLTKGIEDLDPEQNPIAAVLPGDVSPKQSEVATLESPAPRASAQTSPTRRSASERATGEQSDGLPDRGLLAAAQADDAANTGGATRARPSQASSSTSGGSADGAAPDDKGPSEQGADAPTRAANNSPGGQNDSANAQRQRAHDLSGANAPESSATGALQTAAANGGSRQASARSGSEASGQQQDGPKSAAGSAGAQQSSQQANQSGAQGESSNPGASSTTSQGKGQGASRDALKKSRGVASMILGVPVPDEVRGLPNPGLVRTLQKKIAPQAQPVAAADAQDRGARTGALGNLEHPSLQPWMKDLVRDYFSQDSSPEGQP